MNAVFNQRSNEKSEQKRQRAFNETHDRHLTTSRRYQDPNKTRTKSAPRSMQYSPLTIMTNKIRFSMVSVFN
jgi:hypothetical protein